VNGPPKETGALLHAPVSKLRLRTAYLIATLLANTLGWPFWLAEQLRGRLRDRIDSEKHDAGDNQRSDE
jgi:hypothetical protein